MQIKRKQFGGIRPICTSSPAIGMVGGFNLDRAIVNYPTGAVIPGGSLAQFDEALRLVTVLKASRVVAIDAGDPKIVTLESQFYNPIFSVGDSVLKTVTGTFAAAPTITAISDTDNGYIITLSAAIAGLSVGDAIFQVVVDGSSNAKLPIDNPQGLTLNAEPVGTTVREYETSVDVTTDSKGGYFYLHRIPPVPATFINGVCLATNNNILFTNSY